LGLAYFKTGRYSESRDHVEAGGGRENFHSRLALLDKNKNSKKTKIKQDNTPAATYRLAEQEEKEPGKDSKKTAEKQAEPAGAEISAKNEAATATDEAADTTADTAADTAGPAKIEISNGNGVPKMASKVGEYLKAKNLSVTRLTNASHFGYGQTKLFYCQGYLQEAYEVAKQIPGWQNMDRVKDLGASGIKIKVLIGHDIVEHTDMFFKAEKKDDSGTRLAAAAGTYN
ncbi:MAG: LytR C-terminal domain-containing protein, partial [Desulfosalsimonas sp.]